METFGPADFNGSGSDNSGTAVGGPWLNVSNVEVDNTIGADWDWVGNGTTDWIQLWSMSGRNIFPDDAIISNIEVMVRADIEAGTSIWRMDTHVQLGPNGDVKSIIDFPDSTTPTEQTWSGDLAYWGVTNQEAIDALKTTVQGQGLQVRHQFISGEAGRDPEMHYVTVTVEYTVPGKVRYVQMF